MFVERITKKPSNFKGNSMTKQPKNTAGLSIERLKEMTKDESVLQLAKALLMAKAYEQTVASVIVPKQQEVIDTFKFSPSPEWGEKYKGMADFPEIITDLRHLYLLSEEDFQLFEKEMDAFYITSGVKPTKAGNCPLLEAQSLTRNANRYFVEGMESYTATSADDLICYSMEAYKKFTDMMLGLLVSNSSYNFNTLKA